MKGILLVSLLFAAGATSVAAEENDPLAEAQAQIPKTKKRRRFDPLPPAEAFTPELVSDAATAPREEAKSGAGARGMGPLSTKT